MRGSVRRWLALGVACGALALALSPADTARAAEARKTRLGVVHGQHSLNPWNPKPAVEAGTALLASTPGVLQTQALMGWGSLNPEPRPGVYDWSSLDRRIALIRRTGGTPVITLCCAPDWMKGGAPGTTDWKRLEVAPLRSHFDEFARLAAATARRYPDVRYFQVWNEMKGFWDSGRNRWRYEDYTELYNQVYRALKRVNPAIKVGGPYVPMVSWRPDVGGGRNSSVRGPWGMVDQRALDVVTYWLKHAAGADFVAVDGGAALRDGTYLVPPKESAAKFAAINAWLRARTSLPIWWSEVYPVPYSSSGSRAPEEDAAVWASAMNVMSSSGASAAFFWQPEAVPGVTGLWTSTASAGGGQPTALHVPLRSWMR
jgi:hypothetical protein